MGIALIRHSHRLGACPSIPFWPQFRFFACGFVARRLQAPTSLLSPRALPRSKNPKFRFKSDYLDGLLVYAVLLLPLCCAALNARQDALDPGYKLFLLGNVDGAVNFFTVAARENPMDARAKEILANCLVIKAKEDIGAKKYASGRAALGKAGVFFPDRRDLRMLDLLAELEENVPSENAAVSSSSLDASAETNAVFECVFGGEKCAKGKYLVHAVAEGETMSLIAIKYYNDDALWEKIWAANPRIGNPHRLEKGTRLIIPLP